ncbi:hypothetical protein MTBUT4_60076 [Magnetospirillum sp. UT-4]|nr:hypothetical protein MTBUT4_60076 [Magnetospirillum sp. UT-4]
MFRTERMYDFQVGCLGVKVRLGQGLGSHAGYTGRHPPLRRPQTSVESDDTTARGKSGAPDQSCQRH